MFGATTSVLGKLTGANSVSVESAVAVVGTLLQQSVKILKAGSGAGVSSQGTIAAPSLSIGGISSLGPGLGPSPSPSQRADAKPVPVLPDEL